MTKAMVIRYFTSFSITDLLFEALISVSLRRRRENEKRFPMIGKDVK